MSMTYGIIRAVTSGQEFTDIGEGNEECYVYDIVHDGGIEHPPEVSKKVFLSSSCKYRITVDKTGYYLLRANVVYENLVYNEETGETTELKGYFVLKNERGRRINTYYFSRFRETIACKEGESYNGIYIGYGPEDIKRPIRYSTLIYLEENKVYTGNLYLQSSQKADKYCILRLSPNKDIYQYDSPEKNINTGSLPEYPRMEDGIITRVFKNSAEITRYKNELGEVGAFALENDKISGLYCSLMWSINENLVNDFSDFMPPITTNIFYIDQKLGVWLYTQLNYIKNNKEYANALKDKVNNFFVGIGEIVASTGLPIALADEGIIAAGATTQAGVVICIFFLIMHAFENEDDILDKIIELIHGHVMINEEILDTPVAIKVITQRNMERKGLGFNTEFVTRNDFKIELWDGTVIGALGEALQYGKFIFSHYSKASKGKIFDELENQFP